jgi:hypothetical protein
MRWGIFEGSSAYNLVYAGIAELATASAFQAEDRGFEPHCPLKNKQTRVFQNPGLFVFAFSGQCFGLRRWTFGTKTNELYLPKILPKVELAGIKRFRATFGRMSLPSRKSRRP